MPTEVKQKLFSVNEASIILGCSVSSAWRAVREKRLSVVYIGGSTKIVGASIDALIAGATPRPERPYLVKAHTAAADKAHAKAAANRERKEAERVRSLAHCLSALPPSAQPR